MVAITYLLSPWTDVNARQSSLGDSIRALDGIRGMAVLIVLAAHADALGMRGQGSLGVFLFFTLSGFLLTLPFADRPERIFRPREIWHYAANRALRIMPAFVVAVLLVRWQLQASAGWVWANLSFISGWNHFWSVAEEVRFYVLFPFVVAGLALLPSRGYRIAALLVLSLIAWQFQEMNHIDLMVEGLTAPFYFFFFTSGMLACLIHRALAHVDFGYMPDALAAVIAVAAAYLVGWEHPAIWCLLFSLLLIGAANSRGSLIARLFRSWPMRHIGLLSYGIYLFHVSTTGWLFDLHLEGGALLLAVFALTYCIAVASYLLIEKPFLMLKQARPA